MTGPHDLVSIEAGIVGLGDALEHAIPLDRWSLAAGCDRRDERPFEAFIAGNPCFTGDTGAYDPQFYASNASGFPRPARVPVQADGTVEFIRTRDTLEEIFSLPRGAAKAEAPAG